MRTKLVYSAPVGVSDSLDDPIKDPQLLARLANISCLGGKVLDYLGTKFPDQKAFRGGYLRLVWNGKQLQVSIEIDSPRTLNKSELSELREDLDGQVSDGVGESGFDFIESETGLSVETFPDTNRKKSTLVQMTGDAWLPGKIPSEKAANLRRCQEVLQAIQVAEQSTKEKLAKKKSTKPNPKKLFKLIQQVHGSPRSADTKKQLREEIANLGNDLRFIQSGQLPYELFHDPVVLRILLDAGLNPNIHDRDGHSLLWLAVGKVSCIDLLLTRGADINFRNTEVYEDTALMRAAWLGETKAVQLLLDRGADPFLKNRFGKTALDEAQEQTGSGLKETIQILKRAMKS